MIQIFCILFLVIYAFAFMIFYENSDDFLHSLEISFFITLIILTGFTVLSFLITGALGFIK